MVDYRARLDALIEKYKIKPKVHLGQPFSERIAKFCEIPNAFLDYKVNRNKILSDYDLK